MLESLNKIYSVGLYIRLSREDDDKPYYMRGLKEYANDKMFLIDTIKHEQDLYEKTCEELLNFEIEENN